jgi:multicomponent Na+:H+ antiporter subunit G
MSVTQAIALALLAVSSFFFLSGTVGLLRFPDLPSRLHALTKADNLGLGFAVAALALVSGSLAVAVKLLAMWLLALAASAANAYLIAGTARPKRRAERR